MNYFLSAAIRILIGTSLALVISNYKPLPIVSFFIGWAAAALIYGAILPIK